MQVAIHEVIDKADAESSLFTRLHMERFEVRSRARSSGVDVRPIVLSGSSSSRRRALFVSAWVRLEALSAVLGMASKASPLIVVNSLFSGACNVSRDQNPGERRCHRGQRRGAAKAGRVHI